MGVSARTISAGLLVGALLTTTIAACGGDDKDKPSKPPAQGAGAGTPSAPAKPGGSPSAKPTGKKIVKGSSNDPRNLGQTFGLKSLMGQWKYVDPKSKQVWLLAVDKFGALHSKKTGEKKHLGRVESLGKGKFQLSIQDPAAGGTATYQAKLTGRSLVVGVDAPPTRRFVKIK